MREIGVEEARKSLGDLVTEIGQSGEAAIITKHGTPAVVMLPAGYRSFSMYAPDSGIRIFRIDFAERRIDLCPPQDMPDFTARKLLEAMRWALAQEV